MATVTRGWAPLRGVLVGREKFVDLPLPELYDVARDPRETQNLAAANPPRVNVLSNTLKTFNMDPPGRAREETAETVERLRSLGYIGGGNAATKETYTEADDPKRLIELEQTMQRAADAHKGGRAGEAIDLYRRRHRKAAGHGGCLPKARADLLERRPAARGDRDARVSPAQRRDTA